MVLMNSEGSLVEEEGALPLCCYASFPLFGFLICYFCGQQSSFFFSCVKVFFVIYKQKN
jgi:hypothetical protein